jgi:hypothetical protein
VYPYKLNVVGARSAQAFAKLARTDAVRAQSTILGVKRFWHCEIVRHFAYASGLPQSPVQIFRMALTEKSERVWRAQRASLRQF